MHGTLEMLGAHMPVPTHVQSTAGYLAPSPPSGSVAAIAATAAYAAATAAYAAAAADADAGGRAADLERSGPFSGSPYTASGGGGQAYIAPPPPLAVPAAPAPVPGMTTVYQRGWEASYGGGGAYGEGADYEEQHTPPTSYGVPATCGGGYSYGDQPPQPPQPLQPPQPPQPPSHLHPHPHFAEYPPTNGPLPPSYAEPYLYGDSAAGAASLVYGDSSAVVDGRGDGAVSPSVDVPDDWWRHTQSQPAQPKSLLEQLVVGVPPDDASPEHDRVGARSGWKEGL